MKVDQITLQYIEGVVKCASVAKIKNISIEPDKIRGMDDDQTIFLFHTDNIPQLDIGSVGLNRLDVFTSRLEMVSSATTVTIDADTEENKNGQRFARSLTFKGNGIKVDYRCANPAVIRAPKQLMDKVKYRLTMTPEVLFFMNKGVTAMGADEVRLKCVKNAVSFEMIDINGDSMVYNFPTKALELNGDEANFTYSYPIKTVLPLFKTNPEQNFNITGPTGMLKLNIEGFDVYVMPRS